MTTSHTAHSAPATVTPKDFFLWAGVIITLYSSVFAFIALVFSYVDVAFPDALGANPLAYSDGMRNAMATMIIMTPLFFVLMRLIRADIRHHAGKAELWVRKWALVFTLFIAGLTAAIDLITLVNTFLSGELTTRFVLKVLMVLLVAAGFFMHFLADMWGYWAENPRYLRSITAMTGFVVVLSIAASFIVIGTPSQARTYRLDMQRVSDLQMMQVQIINYYQHKGHLPTTLSDIIDPISYPTLPTDPEKHAYEYELGRIDPHRTHVQLPRFSLCATFGAASQDAIPSSYASVVTANESWWHGTGRFCLDRTVDPQLYPRIKDTDTGVTPLPMLAPVKALR